MLEQLLAEIRSGGTLEVSALAERLDTTPELVTVMLEHLQRAGHLRPYPAGERGTGQTCGDACAGCSLKSACQREGKAAGARLWQG